MALLCATAASVATAAPVAGTFEVGLEHQGRQRFFLLHVPPQAAAGRPLPLVLNFHGGGGEPVAHEAWTAMDALADREGFIVVYPAGFSPRGEPGRRLLTWNAGTCCGPAQDDDSDDVGFVRKVLSETSARVPVDATRVYATGMSNGAMMTYRLARELSNRLAAIAPVSGASETPPPVSALPVPVLHIHSVDDPRALYAGGEGPPFPFTDRRVRHPPVEAVLRLWAAHNGCPAAPTAETPRVSSAGHTATRLTYGPCASGKPVVLWRLTGSGHVWPGVGQKYPVPLLGAATDVINANDEIWAFFRAFQRPDAPALTAPTASALTASTAAPTAPVPPESLAGRELPFSRHTLVVRAVGARDRSAADDAVTRTGSLAVRASTTLFGNLRLDRDGARASGLIVGVDGRVLSTDALSTDAAAGASNGRFYRLGASLGGFYLTPTRHLYWLQAGAFVAEQSALLDAPKLRVYGLGLGTAQASASTTLIYGLGYTFDFGRGLPLPFLGLGWRCSPAWRLDVLLPILARLTWRASDDWAMTFGTAVQGDLFRYQGHDAQGANAVRLLRIARLRAGVGGRYTIAPGVRLEAELGVEGAVVQDDVTTRRTRGGFLAASLVLGRGHDELFPSQ